MQKLDENKAVAIGDSPGVFGKSLEELNRLNSDSDPDVSVSGHAVGISLHGDTVRALRQPAGPLKHDARMRGGAVSYVRTRCLCVPGGCSPGTAAPRPSAHRGILSHLCQQRSPTAAALHWKSLQCSGAVLLSLDSVVWSGPHVVRSCRSVHGLTTSCCGAAGREKTSSHRAPILCQRGRPEALPAHREAVEPAGDLKQRCCHTDLPLPAHAHQRRGAPHCGRSGYCTVASC